jgi:hypothetical protein
MKRGQPAPIDTNPRLSTISEETASRLNSSVNAAPPSSASSTSSQNSPVESPTSQGSSSGSLSNPTSPTIKGGLYMDKIASARATNRYTGQLDHLECRYPKEQKFFLPKGSLKVDNSTRDMSFNNPAGTYFMILNIGITPKHQPNLNIWSEKGLFIINLLNDSLPEAPSSKREKQKDQKVDSFDIGNAQETVNTLRDEREDFTKNLYNISQFQVVTETSADPKTPTLKTGSYLFLYTGDGALIIKSRGKEYSTAPGYWYSPDGFTPLQLLDYFNLSEVVFSKIKEAEKGANNIIDLDFSKLRMKDPKNNGADTTHLYRSFTRTDGKKAREEVHTESAEDKSARRRQRGMSLSASLGNILKGGK